MSSTKKIILSIVGIIALVSISYALLQNYLVNRGVNQEIDELENEIIVLENKNIEYEELLKYFDSQAYAEQKARLELGMKKVGENVVVISDEDNLAINLNNQNPINNNGESNPIKWFKYLFIQ